MVGAGQGVEQVSRGYQGVVYKVPSDTVAIDGPAPESHYLIVKEAMGFVLIRKLRQIMIRREHEVYRHLDGIPGIPKCYGLKDGKRLLLEFVDGRSLRDAYRDLPDWDAYFGGLLEIILSMHRAGVAHADLKRKDNILVTSDGRPCLVDFGTAVVRKASGALNHWIFRQACQIDLNAWIKQKYQGLYDEISAEDAQYFRPTVVERCSRFVREIWYAITGRRRREQRRRA